MKFLKYISLFTSLSLLFSCDDGDIVINNFEFQDNQLTFCNTTNRTVLYNINSSNEVISIELNEVFTGLTETDENGRRIQIGSAAQVVYRKFSDRLNGSDYFCSPVPDNTNTIVNELIGDNQGQIIIRTAIVADDDIDKDGIPNTEEGFIADMNDEDLRDSDNDGIPDYRDIDDDNDNVRTLDELALVDDPDKNDNSMIRVARDTDGDSINDHLDPDDDNDSILTRNEVVIKNRNPAIVNGVNGIAKYLDPEDTSSNTEADELLDNVITNVYRTTIVSENLGLSDPNGDTTIIRDNFVFGVFTRSGQMTNVVPINTPVTPVTTTP
ncbi:hypothetical protein [Aquimarina agarilytica]|uniref:hypothetical protein n=1 Tax=Aquimarina agarilytica TaxID=1087449 RepID=UPI000289E600|nr:hypothetical protein [Aquimarina agarilytica]